MSKKLLCSLIASLFAAPVLAQSDSDPIRVEGGATAGGIYNRTNAFDKAQFDLYQDLNNGALSNVWARGRNSTNWFEGYGENFGRDDQYMFLRGGIYDVFKAGGYLNDMPHIFSTNAFTPYNGTGGTVLTATFPLSSLPNPTPPANWNNFTLGYQRRDAGGYFEWQKQSPWYFRVDGNEITFSGTKVGSAANGSSPGNGFVDLAIPTNWTTKNIGAEAGYQSGKATYSVRWDYSKFDNSNQTLQWTNPFFGGNQLDTSFLAPDNTFNKFTLTGNYRDLPWRSVISARYTWSKTTSNTPLALSALDSGGTFTPTQPDQNNFNGEKINQSFQLAWTASPAKGWETRAYYNWTKLQNHSDVIQFGNAPLQPLGGSLGCGNFEVGGVPTQISGNCENRLFSYTKNNAGVDAWWKFAPGNRLGVGYDYNNIDQTRVDYDKAHWSTVWAEYKNTMLDTFSGRFKYQYIKKDSTSNFSNNGLPGGANNNEFLLPFTSAFDMQASTTNQAKLNLDWTPLNNVGLWFEGLWSKTDFDDVTLGRTEQEKQGYYLGGNWNISSAVKLNAFGSWEQAKYPSNHRYIGTVAGGPNPPSGWCTTANPNCYDPSAPPFQQSPGSTTASYNWNSSTKDETWMIGAGADWQAMDRLVFTASYLYIKNTGNADFGIQAPIVLNNPPVLPITNFDNSTQQFFNLKAAWAYNKSWSFTGGYAFNKFSHNDIATNGYTYVAPAANASPTNTSLSYLNGYDAFTDGHQNIFYAYVTYKFDAPSLPAAPERKMAEAPRPAAPPPPSPPPPAPAPKAPQLQKVTLDSKVLFDFDKAELKPEGKVAIDNQVVAKLAQVQKLEVVVVTGYTDRLGSEAHNQKLSERRADAVRDYLVSKGVPKDKIESIGMDSKQPIVQCDQKNLKDLIACLQPNRRVEVQVKGESAM
jgi:outer membrane protein OmpA-like peptidoglycan-associated protein